MTAEESLNPNWANVPALPEFFRYDQYNFYSYNIISHYILRLFNPENPLLFLRRINIFYQFIAIFSVICAAKNSNAGRWQILVGAALLIVSPALVFDAHIARAESFLYALFGILLWILSSRLPLPWIAFAVGIVLGFGTATKVSFLLVALVALPLGLQALRQDAREAIGAAGLGMWGLVIGFLAGAPHVLDNFEVFMNGVEYLQKQYSGQHPPHSSPSPNWGAETLRTILFCILLNGPILISILFVPLRKKLHWCLGAIFFGVVVTIYFGSKPVFFERNINIAIFSLLAVAPFLNISTRIVRASIVASFSVMLFWSAQIALEVGILRPPNDRFSQWLAFNKLEGTPVIFAPFKAVETVENCDGMIGLYDFGDQYSKTSLEQLRQVGLISKMDYNGRFGILPTSTLHTYLDADVHFFDCGIAPDS